MPKPQHSTYVTSLSVDQIKSALSSVLAGATIESLFSGPLDEPADIALVASRTGGVFKKSPFGPGNAVAQVVVVDRGSARHVELVAMALTFMEGMNVQRAAGNAMAGLSAAKQAPNPKAGKKMVAAIHAALRAADPGLREG